VQKYLLRRLLYGVLTLFGVSVIIFVVMRILPGDPLVAMFGMEGFMKLSEADRAHIMQELGLSDSLPIQYARWMRDVAHGSLGKSFFRGESVAEIIRHRGPLSAEIGLFSVLISWIVGLPVGIISAFRPNSLMDNLARSLSILFLAVPGFWLGMLIVLALLFWFNYKAPLLVVHIWQDPWMNFQLVIGPAIGPRPGSLHRPHVAVLPPRGHP
jgi:peptide/nickel transport system permease protein